MKTIHPKVTIVLSPSTADYKVIRAKFLELTGTDNIYEHRTVWDNMVREACIKWEFNNISLEQAQIHAELIRIQHSNQCVSIHAGEGNFIGNTTWDDQVKMFFEYPTYTERGKEIIEARKKEAKALGIVASWE